MIDEFVIFERGGTVLWRRSFVALKGDPLAILVRSALLEDRLSLEELSFDCYTLRWVLDNSHGIVFAVIFQRRLPPAYANDLLQMVRKRFIRDHLRLILPPPSITPSTNQYVVDPNADTSQFTPIFETLLKAAENRSMLSSKTARSTRRKKPTVNSNDIPNNNIDNESNFNSSEPNHDSSNDSQNTESTTLSKEDVVKRNREAFIRRQPGRRKGGGTGTHGKGKSRALPLESVASTTEPVPRGKVMRPSKKSLEEDVSNLDFSTAPSSDNNIEDYEVVRFRQQFMDATPNNAYDIISDSSDDENDNYSRDNKKDASSGGMFNYFKGLAGMRSLTHNDLEPVMNKFREALISKNVAREIADKLIDSVLTSLEGKKMESMTSVTTTVRNALDEALTRILTSKQSTDILADIAASKGRGRPYVITYCGVNGVGKSTSLAKTCYYLLNHGYKVLIAACDTFRAGAVEQLKTHVKCLGRGVELFDRGYGKDAAAVANDAIRKAKEIKYDVVLVDTAGRMQDNEPLMRALAKLVEVNQPDRLFFVGEALVGNDAVDQLTKFNAALTDHQNSNKPRLIDGIVLTKFDTIDDKVGAAVSMVYTTGQPIVFVGVGQTYMDLRKINTKSLVKALLK